MRVRRTYVRCARVVHGIPGLLAAAEQKESHGGGGEPTPCLGRVGGVRVLARTVQHIHTSPPTPSPDAMGVRRSQGGCGARYTRRRRPVTPIGRRRRTRILFSPVVVSCSPPPPQSTNDQQYVSLLFTSSQRAQPRRTVPPPTRCDSECVSVRARALSFVATRLPV